MSGWIKTHRQLTSNGLWNDKPFARGQAWLDILLNTSYEKSVLWVRGIRVDISPGQCAMSTHTMAKRWGWSRKKVSSFLKHLEKELQIEPQKTNVTTLITITKWNHYQQKEPQNAQQKNHKGTTEEPIKEVKKLRNTSFPETLTPDSIKEWSEKKGWPVTEDIFESFRDHHMAIGSTFISWEKALQKWVRNHYTDFGKKTGEVKKPVEGRSAYC